MTNTDISSLSIFILFSALSSSLSTSGRTQWSTWMVQDRFLRSQWPVTKVALASLQQSGRNELILSQWQWRWTWWCRWWQLLLLRHDNEEMTKVDGFQEPGSFRQVIVIVNPFFFHSCHLIRLPFPHSKLNVLSLSNGAKNTPRTFKLFLAGYPLPSLRAPSCKPTNIFKILQSGNVMLLYNPYLLGLADSVIWPKSQSLSYDCLGSKLMGGLGGPWAWWVMGNGAR